MSPDYKGRRNPKAEETEEGSRMEYEKGKEEH